MSALDQLEQKLPKNRLLVTDGGRFMTECSHLSPTSQKFRSQCQLCGYRSYKTLAGNFCQNQMHSCVCLYDGGFSAINEFHSCLRMKINLLVIVCNDMPAPAEYGPFLLMTNVTSLIRKTIGPLRLSNVSRWEIPSTPVIAISLDFLLINVWMH